MKKETMMILRVASKKRNDGAGGCGRERAVPSTQLLWGGQLQKRTKVMEVFLFLDLHTEQCTCSAYDLKYKKRGCVV